jgi:hypothetical protein
VETQKITKHVFQGKLSPGPQFTFRFLSALKMIAAVLTWSPHLHNYIWHVSVTSYNRGMKVSIGALHIIPNKICVCVCVCVYVCVYVCMCVCVCVYISKQESMAEVWSYFHFRLVMQVGRNFSKISNFLQVHIFGNFSFFHCDFLLVCQ